jgi:hypothetical protein
VRHEVIEPDTTIDLGRYVTFPDGYQPANPSIVNFGEDLLVCVRGVAYTIDEKLGVHGNGGRRPSLNRCFLLNKDLSFKSMIQLPHELLDNVEDLKLFSGLGRIWGVGSVPINASLHANACVLTLVEFDAELSGCSLVRLASPFDFALEKNWAPFFATDAIHFIYSFCPPVMLRYDPTARSVTALGSKQAKRGSLKFLEGASSAGITAESGTIFLTHRRVVRLPDRKRIYLSRIRHLSPDFGSLVAGPFFSIGRPTIQFANGMLFDKNRVLIAYGEMDSTARLASFSRTRFENAVCPAHRGPFEAGPVPVGVGR